MKQKMNFGNKPKPTKKKKKFAKYFSLSELVHTNHIDLQIANQLITQAEIKKLSYLATKILDPIRENFRLPMQITSGYRSAELNKKIGGSPTSQHSLCEAADFVINGLDDMEGSLHVFDWIRANINIPYGQVIHETNKLFRTTSIWIHISSGEPYRPVDKCRQALKYRRGEYFWVT